METAFFSFFRIKLLLLLGNIPQVSLSCASPGRLGKTYPNPRCLMTTTMRYQSHHPLGAPLAHVCGRFLAHLHWRSTKKSLRGDKRSGFIINQAWNTVLVYLWVWEELRKGKENNIWTLKNVTSDRCKRWVGYHYPRLLSSGWSSLWMYQLWWEKGQNLNRKVLEKECCFKGPSRSPLFLSSTFVSDTPDVNVII